MPPRGAKWTRHGGSKWNRRSQHECAHAAPSRWGAPKGTDAAWSAAATALEESRIEARQVRRRPADRAWLRACTCQIVIGDFTAAAAPPASAAEAGSAAALILARQDARILQPPQPHPPPHPLP